MKLYVALVRGNLRHKFRYAGECVADNGVDMSIDVVMVINWQL